MRGITLFAACLLSLTTPVRASWTIAVLPDTQNYTNLTNSLVFDAQTQWIVDNKDALGIEIVLHEGDITNNNVVEEWEIAKNAISTLDGQVPYMLALGNHDYLPHPSPFDDAYRPQTKINDYFSLSDNPLNATTVEMVPGDLANTYRTFAAPDSRKMLIFSLEYDPREEVMDWAGSIADSLSDHMAIVVLHRYLRELDEIDGQPAAQRTISGNKIWDGLTGQHESIEMVLNGHYLDKNDTDPYGRLMTARQSSVGLNGNIVHEIAFNSQQLPNGGDGYLRLLEFIGNTVQVRTYSPTLDIWATNDRNEFQIELTAIPEPTTLTLTALGLVGMCFRRRKRT
jgi:hypothetical protein